MSRVRDTARVLASYLGTRLRRFPDRDGLEHWQGRQLRRSLARLRRSIPALAEAPLDLADWPVVDKPTALARFADWNVAGVDLGTAREIARLEEGESSTRWPNRAAAGYARWSFGLSSGTSGAPGAFLLSREERLDWAGTILAKALPKGLLAGARIALFLRAANPLYETLGSRRVQFAFLDLRHPFDVLVHRLDTVDPTVLVAPAGVLRMLADEQRSGRLAIRPDLVYSVAEVLDDDVAADVQAAFDRRVDQIYQASEGFLGISCAEGRVHLNEDLLIFEREEVDPGSGRWTPIVTDLRRRSQAIVRYRMGDVLVDGDGPCPCGSVFRSVVRIEGRADDVLRFADAYDEKRTVPVFPDLVIRAAFAAAPGLRDVRCVQTGAGTVELAIESENGADTAAVRKRVEEALRELARCRGARPPRIEPVPWPEEPLSRKRRRVQRISGAGDASSG